MDNNEVIRSINRVYDRFTIIQNLRLHMLRVAAVGELILENWNATSIKPNRDEIVAALLIHDLGNIAKFDFDNPKFWSGYSTKEVDYWKNVKEQTISKYGSPIDHVVTLGMAKELDVNERLIFLISNMAFQNIDAVLKSDDFGLKICTYADQRVAPSGVVSIQDRFDDLRKRYSDPNKHGYAVWNEGVALQLEQQIFNNTSITPSRITDYAVKSYIEKYSK